MDADVIIVGAGLAGLTAAHELTSRGRRVALVDQENAANLGGQAFWSFGGLFFVGSPEQRRLGVNDSFDLAWSDWLGSAQFDRHEDEDSWAVRWARAYVEFAAGEKRSWLVGHGLSFLPAVGWAERGDLRADGHGNTVPRFHITWGTGTGVVEPFVRQARQAGPAGCSPSTTGTASTSSWSPTARSPASAAPCWRPTTRRAASPPAARPSASSNSPRRR